MAAGRSGESFGAQHPLHTIAWSDAVALYQRWAADACHKLSATIRELDQSVTLCQQEQGDTPEASAHWRSLRNTRQDLVRFLDELSAFAGRRLALPRTVDLADWLASKKTDLARRLGSGRQLNLVIRQKPLLVRGDPKLLAEVWEALLDNSAQAGASRLDLAVSRIRLDQENLLPGLDPGVYVCARFRDDGSGVTLDPLEEAFLPFSSTKEYHLGLGLSAVWGLVQQMKGTVVCQTTPPTSTTVSLYLPAAEDQPTVAEDVGSKVVRPAASGKVVLIIDDERLVIRSLSRLLQALGHQVFTAETGENALALLRDPDCKPDLLICDAVLPDSDGYQLVADIKTNNPSMGTILISGNLPETNRVPAHTSFIQKPFEPNEFLKLVASLLND